MATITDADITVPPVPESTLPPPTAVDGATTDRQLEILEALDQTVRANYVDPGLNGVDWPALVEQYRTSTVAGLDDDQFDAVLNALIAELGDEHSYVQSPADVAAAQAELEGQQNYVGVGASFLPISDPPRLVVIAPLAGGPAERAGIQPHDVVVAIDGAPVPADRDEARSSTRGPAGTSVTLSIERADLRRFDITLVREAVSSPSPMPTCLVAGTGLGYVALTSLFDLTVPDRMSDSIIAMAAREDLKGLVLDNRLNGGGDSRALAGVLELLLNGTVGSFKSPQSQRDFIVEGRDIAGSQGLPLAVLVGQGTASFGEVLSGLLQQQDGATVIGTTTEGNVETLSGYELPHGWRTWLAHEVFVPAQSEYGPWEDTGIVPDRHVPTRWDLFTEANDPALAAAVEALSTN